MLEISRRLCVILRLEGLLILSISAILYHKLAFSWSDFFWLFLIPDISLLGYIFNSKIGCVSYNITHSLIGPLLLLALSYIDNNSLLIQLGLIWIAHIGFDRALGYGLKYSKGFSYTHLGKIGRNSNT